MTITINYEPKPSPGYTPRKARRLYNVLAVQDAGVRMVRVVMSFTDVHPTHDHVVSVVLTPGREE